MRPVRAQNAPVFRELSQFQAEGWMKLHTFQGRAVVRAAAIFLGATALAASCNTVRRATSGPVEAVVTLPSSVPGEQEQYIVEASANRQCEAGVRAFRNNEWEMAMTAFNQALMDDPEDEYAHFALGICYEMKGDLKQALQHYEEANRIPRKPNLNYSTSVARVKAKLAK